MRMGLGGAGALGPLRLGHPLTAHAAVLDVVEHFPDLRTPPESSGTFWKLPGTIPKNPNFSRNPNNNFPYINLYLWTIPELLATSGISSGPPTTFGNHVYLFPITLASSNLKCVDPTGSGTMQT